MWVHADYCPPGPGGELHESTGLLPQLYYLVKHKCRGRVWRDGLPYGKGEFDKSRCEWVPTGFPADDWWHYLVEDPMPHLMVAAKERVSLAIFRLDMGRLEDERTNFYSLGNGVWRVLYVSKEFMQQVQAPADRMAGVRYGTFAYAGQYPDCIGRRPYICLDCGTVLNVESPADPQFERHAGACTRERVIG